MTRENTRSMLEFFCALEGIEPNFSDSTLDTIHSLIQSRIKIDEYEQGVKQLTQDVDEFIDALKKMKEGAA